MRRPASFSGATRLWMMALRHYLVIADALVLCDDRHLRRRTSRRQLDIWSAPGRARN
jgi:hypothetical protein